MAPSLVEQLDQTFTEIVPEGRQAIRDAMKSTGYVEQTCRKAWQVAAAEEAKKVYQSLLDGIGFIRGKVLAQLRAESGFCSAELLVDTSADRGLFLTVWTGEEVATRADAVVNELRDEAVGRVKVTFPRTERYVLVRCPRRQYRLKAGTACTARTLTPGSVESLVVGRVPAASTTTENARSFVGCPYRGCVPAAALGSSSLAVKVSA